MKLRRASLLIFLFLLSLYALTSSGRLGSSGDGHTMYLVARSLVYEGNLDIPPQKPAVAMNEDNPNPVVPYGDYGPDGKYYAKYGLGTSLAMAPLVALGKALSTTGDSLLHPYFPQLTASWFNSIILALAGVTFFLTALQLGFTFPTALTLLFAFALSWVWPYTKTAYSEPLTLWLLLLTVYAGVQMQHSTHWGWMVLFGAASGAAVLTRVSAVMFLPVLYLYLLLTQKDRYLRRSPHLIRNWAATFLPLAGFLLLVGWYNAFRFGSPLSTGYETQNWLTPFFEGLYGLTLSPGKGLLWYLLLTALSPLGFWYFNRRRPNENKLFLGLVVIWIVFHSPYTYWSGGWSWGPRFLLPIVPYLLLPLGALIERKPARGEKMLQLGLAALLALSIIVQVPAVVADYSRHLLSVYEKYPDDFDHQVLFTWESSPLPGQWISILEVTSIARQPEITAQLQENAWETAYEDADTAEEQVAIALNLLAANLPDLWFVSFPLLGLAAKGNVTAVLGAQIGLVILFGWMLSRLHPPGETAG